MDKLKLILGTVFVSVSISNGQTSKSETKNSLATLSTRDALDSIEDFIAQKSENFAIKNQEFDIFGKPQNPSKEVAQVESQRVQEVQKPKVPLQKLIDELEVSVADPTNQRVVFQHNQTVRRGEKIQLDYQGNAVVFVFEGCRPDYLYFRDIESKELIVKNLRRLANGISKGKSGTSSGIQKIGSGTPQVIKIGSPQVGSR